MLFNSFSFALFLPVVFLLYWLIGSRRRPAQNFILLAASYYFYASWDWRFLFLLIFSTLLDYVTGLKIFAATSRREQRIWLWMSVCANLGFLGFFKYYNFFAASFAEAISHLGLHASPWTLQLILPVGISFYTFHGLSYVIDIYYGRINPEREFIGYSLFVSFFPLLVAGPIERATHLLPQVMAPRTFDAGHARDGLRQMLWGFFKKMVVADNCARYVNEIFGSYHQQPGAMLIAGSVLFMFQVYGDFSGYSDIAIGCARLFGFSLMRNFAYPYFSRDLAEFWRRWHISFTTWFRDYVFIPLGGSRASKLKNARNIMIVFLLSGFWHGAAWTFIIWGGLHGLFYLMFVLAGRHKANLGTVAAGRLFPSVKELLQMLATFMMCTLCLTIFRSASVTDAFRYVGDLFVNPFGGLAIGRDIYGYLLLMLLVEWVQREQPHGLAIGRVAYRPVRWAIYTCLVLLIFFEGATLQNFIYFQF